MLIPFAFLKLMSMPVRYAAFFSKFEQQATDGKLSKAKCIDNATACILEVFRHGRDDSDLQSQSGANPNLEHTLQFFGRY